MDKDFCVKNRTEPCHVLQVAEVIAGVKGINDHEVLETCRNNVFCLFGNLSKK
jgi:Tat protein secretion system quality control protein TatD with DNase activity